jgi:leucyl/phenylalanyl-tRNA--protein transferase
MEERRIIPPEYILSAYRKGYFPMAESSEAGSPIYLYTAQQRGIIPIDGFHLSKRSKRYIRKYGFKTTINQNFEAVIDGCANRASTWISPEIRDSFTYLHELGMAHSVEIWKDEELVGGLYGVAIGAAFFAESMFQTIPEAHKAALFFCHKHLVETGFKLWDVQFLTAHLTQFGCIEIPAAEYKRLLKKALKEQANFDGIHQSNSPSL